MNTVKDHNGIEYRVINDTAYHTSTSFDVISILEYSRMSRKRLVLTYGKDGKVWEEATPLRGHIGRSTGSVKVPLLIRTSRSMGGEEVLDDAIVEIRTSPGNRVLWKR